MSAVKHGFSAEVTKRDFNNRATQWVGRCGRHVTFVGPSYEDIEDQWRRHVHAMTGKGPSPLGNQENRWMPERVTT